MSFIPHRDVFDMSDAEVQELEDLYDILEEQFEEGYVRDECGPDWTVQKYTEHYGRHPCPTFGAFSMLVFAYQYFKKNGLPHEGEGKSRQ